MRGPPETRLDPEQVGAAIGRRARRRVCVLMVEDDDETQRLLAERLRNQGYEVFSTASGRAGLVHLVTDGVPDLVVVGLGLADLDGWAIARNLRSLPATAGVPIMVVSAHGTGPDEVPVDARLVKPFTLQEFDAAVAGALAQGDRPIAR